MNTVNTDINTEITTNVNTEIINVPKSRNTVVNKVVVANAPVRIDLAGGWSDTPPICYETEGAVRLKTKKNKKKYFFIFMLQNHMMKTLTWN